MLIKMSMNIFLKSQQIRAALFVVTLCLLLDARPAWAKKLNASQAFDDTWNTASDLENELEQQKRAKGQNAGGGGPGQWSTWSDWSTCSRTCDGGIMQQIRRCSNSGSCRGESARFRICNMQPCPEQQDFRSSQCAAYNDVPYDGTLYKWTPHYDYVEPCALTCRGHPAHLVEDISRETGGGHDEESEHYDEQSVIVQLSARVQDGTRCRSGSLDMCIQGKCQRVGCDLKIGSTKKIDGCGVCGGDGNSCSQPLYYWEMAPMSQCSATCGGGYKMARPICRNRLTNADVDDTLCSLTNRPEASVEQCNTHSCPPRWITDDWSTCSRLCGHGYRERMVVCAEESNAIKTRVADIMCRSPKPPTQETCIIEECPHWEVEDWTGCSVSCGQGIQMRGVECKSTDGSLSAKCDPLTKPGSMQQCSTGIPCGGDGASQNKGGGTIIVGSSRSGNERSEREMDRSDVDDDDDEDLDDEAEDIDDMESGQDTDDGEGLSYADQPLRYSHQTQSRLHQEAPNEPRTMRLTSGNSNSNYNRRGGDIDVPSLDPSFVKDTDWSPCSVTCGEGIRRRSYKCKIFLEYSRTVATVNDSLCEGTKPHDEAERCVEDPCVLPSHGFDDQFPRDSIKVGVSEPGKTYVWREQGYTSCSASCLGGVEELIINCVREDNGRVVSPFLCSPETKPEARVRTCNDRPCPPRWNYSDYTPCSKSCGIGIKTREVQCIHEVTRGGENTMVVPNSMCPQPPPADRQYCNVLDCPVRWEVGEWSKCSHTCGYGFKDRKVECKQIMAQEHKIERPESMCPSAKPPDKKPCNVKPCPPEDPKPVIQINNSTHIQHDPKKTKITLKVGGAGVVFFGTQVKIKCPVKRYNRTKIKWSKDHKPLQRSRKFKVSKKGALRILDITFRDAGVYSCHAGLSSAEISIEVKAKPGQQAEELERQESDRLVRERSGTEALTSADMTSVDGAGVGAGTGSDGHPDGSTQQQGTRRRQQQSERLQNGRERSRRPKSDGVQHADSSIMEDDHSQLVKSEDRVPQPASASSGGSRTRTLLAMPYFQALLSHLQLLWPLQRFKDSRGQHLLRGEAVKYGLDSEAAHFEQDEPVRAMVKELHTEAGPIRTVSESTGPKEVDAGQDPDMEILPHMPHARWETATAPTTTAVPGLESADYVYKWQLGKWSKCSQDCGADGSGLQRRTLGCRRVAARAGNSSAEEVVDNSECTAHGLEPPQTFRSCGNEPCPQWTRGEWSLCQQSRCHGKNTAVQRREVACRHENGTAGSACDEYERPVMRQECYNERCKGVWRVEPWSECNAPCGRQGIKYRILQCVWYGSRRPAGNVCKHQPRPAVMKICKSPSCQAKMSSSFQCRDSSRYCRNARAMGLCRLHRYKEKCCGSCQQQQQQPDKYITH
ncbi:protein madd-4 isoform X1 [Drosophila kikkawai]|uniref:Protein madd-4 isoform X1 n=1 Tax=Drosophila kikkawai TaxID=30033 RepID=A0ABM3C7M2_DROKI|nr:protein madd-4 isoform X1 [Drosophila kikkawai]XP_041632766.1 protein madd-4 isoform X1 [Drosophila kikkawai]XP_041632767.1 protein madd-4 isoform X1 [Drosophila kikkawai]XP_041632768.1 protein madd-4 isoform X1 [Drosophila kikkawai]XP_041632769.1 protein madd-4 isoform X1 [Drosophila kikkawai]XP_041632770.1 protein madd-4 isoform X1 [Drosophila kikkawai]XP_041632771.1 protein madd-4 isoform X1 [Drosophila kikkawai]